LQVVGNVPLGSPASELADTLSDGSERASKVIVSNTE